MYRIHGMAAGSSDYRDGKRVRGFIELFSLFGDAIVAHAARREIRSARA